MGFVCRFSLALARGVGQSCSNSVRLPPLDRVPEQARGVGQFVSLADGEDEEPLTLVGRADFRRREEACRKAVAHADQSCGDFGEAEAEMMGDVLEEDKGRLDLADDPGDMWPEVARVIRAPALARDGERLARIARSDDVHCAAPRAAVEGSNVVPDNSLIQGRVFHPRHESGCGVGFPFDIAHSTISGDGDGEPEVETARAGQRDRPNRHASAVPEAHPEEGRARSCIASARLFCQLGEGLARAVEHCRLSGELLPPGHSNIDVGGVELDPEADTPRRFRRDQCGA